VVLRTFARLHDPASSINTPSACLDSTALLRANNATRSTVAVAAPASAVFVLPTPSHRRAIAKLPRRTTRHTASSVTPSVKTTEELEAGRAEVAAHGFLPRLREC
jgi:hypothetical protein